MFHNSRMGGTQYARTKDRFEMIRPIAEHESRG